MPIKDPELRKASARRTRAKHGARYNEERRGKRKEKSAEYNARPEVKERNRSLKRLKKYGVSQEQFDRKFQEQGFCCAICLCKEPTTRRHYWHTDHSHTTGRFRGVLCSNCNVMLGYGADSADRLIAGANYLILQKEIESCI